MRGAPKSCPSYENRILIELGSLVFPECHVQGCNVAATPARIFSATLNVSIECADRVASVAIQHLRFGGNKYRPGPPLSATNELVCPCGRRSPGTTCVDSVNIDIGVGYRDKVSRAL